MTTVLVCLLLASAVLAWPSRRPEATQWLDSLIAERHAAGQGSPPVPGQPRRAGAAPTAGSPRSSAVLDGIRARVGVADRPHASVEEVADALVLVGLALRAGLPLADALHHVQADAGRSVRGELGAVVAALHWGRPAYDAWGFAGPGWRVAALATHMSEQTGAAPAGLIWAAAARLREERERQRERAAARAGVLLVLPLGLGFLPAFACTAVVPVVLNLASGVLAGA